MVSNTAHMELGTASKCYAFAQPNLYPMSAVNKIVFSPNKQSCLFYATGYQAGFVRISWMEFLKSDIKQL